ncbi:hypothetical protein Dshi_2391 [Dinoroseobacter shibae DFL 12 = DSM 16493]|jgi:fatty acid desaturase|uniref:Uncharacterized protein n=1 Tax=Dinoroseobacter shibae (strain DSM 16493 / NCIMB 14021 / DFL 12) TaxID=398580 RepID=A8LS34_DINSH|nr:hypothetical protein [Dinoroseobacter shibae]ABV94127.1 hypothetical protein Dshi_2391 [Dinoroseobacter shibae DFL 12 = DSM 16493]URF45568.1 hypothetical protein M8008_12360 [Dinoroseobacter shibae]URF49873.1 hypothetical protein M8007_12360 [Dinoroseobacter shibae]
MTTLTTNTPISAPAPKSQKVVRESRFDASVNKDEVQFILLALAIIGLWGGATLVFGYAGLIVGALTMVAAIYAALVLISRG